jgi:hypothetical protein
MNKITEVIEQIAEKNDHEKAIYNASLGIAKGIIALKRLGFSATEILDCIYNAMRLNGI